MEKEGLEKEFGHAVKSPGLIKMSSFRENAFGMAWKDCIQTHLNDDSNKFELEKHFLESPKMFRILEEPR